MVINLRKKMKIILLVLAGVLIIFSIFQLPFVQRTSYPMPYKAIVQKNANQFGVDPLLVTAVMREESKFMPKSQSNAGAVGLMQLMPETAQWAAEKIGLQEFQPANLNRPEVNIMLGSWYLSNLSKQFNNNTVLVLAAYNGGSGRVKDWLARGDISPQGRVEEIPIPETRAYVRKVLNSYAKYIKLYPNYSS